MRPAMRPSARASSAGFTMVEMMVTLLLFSILMTLGIPTMRAWITNVKVRSVADALQNGVRVAQAESLRRSRQVVFSLTNTVPVQAGVYTPITAAANGIYWSVNLVPLMTDGSDAVTFIQSGQLGAISSSNVAVTGPAEICFNSSGRLVAQAVTGVAGGTCTLPVNNPPVWVYKVTLAGADHPLWVQVTLGGKLHLCDPSQTLSTTNTYGC